MEVEETAISDYSKEAAKGSFWTLLGSVIFKFVSFIYVIILARVASQNDIGVFYLALGVFSLVTIFSDLGISGSVGRYVPYFEGRGERAKIKDLMRIGYFVMVGMGTLLSLVLWWQADAVGAIYNSPQLVECIRVLSIYVIITNLMNINQNYLSGMTDMKSVQQISNLQNGLKLVLTLLFFYLFGASLTTIAASFILSFIPALLFSSYKVWKKGLFQPVSGEGMPKAQLFSELIPFGFMLALLTSMSVIFSASDRLLLGYLTPAASSASVVAVYSLAITMATVLNIFPGSVGSIFFPLISRLAGKEDKPQMRTLMETAQRWTLFISIPFGLVFIIFSAEMLHFFYGSNYAIGTIPMAIFSTGLIISYLTNIVSLALAAMRMVKIELMVVGLGAIANIVLCVIFIPMWGMEGAAAASAVSFIIMGVALNHFAHRLIGFRFPPEVFRLLGAAALTCIVILLIKPQVMLLSQSFLDSAASIGTSIYITKVINLIFIGSLAILTIFIFIPFGLVLKCFHKEDVAIMRAALRKIRVPEDMIVFAQKIVSYGVETKNAPSKTTDDPGDKERRDP